MSARQLTAEEKQVAAQLADPWWRLRNLYMIRPEGGGLPRPFEPRAEQEMIYKHLLETPHEPAFIVKSRRLGFSTALGVFAVDLAAWTAGQQCMLVDMTQPDAHKKMREIIRYAYDALPAPIRSHLSTPKREDSQLSIRAAGHDEQLDSHIYAGMNARGGDCSLLWVSEWGKFQNDAKHRTRSQEISAGAWNTARKGRRVVETTWQGGRNGELWELIKPVLEKNVNAEGKVYFFPWHADPTCVSITGMVTAEVEEYFKDIEQQLGKEFTEQQKKWWAVKKTEQRGHMKTEFPSTLDEALSSPGLQPRFSVEAMEWMERMMMKPESVRHGYIKHDKNTRAAQFIPTKPDDETAWYREMETPRAGCSYIIPIDFCTAKQVVSGDPDFHALPVLRAAYQDEAGTIHPIRVAGAISIDNRTVLKTFCAQIAAIQDYYGGAIVVPETNNMGGIIDLMRDAGVTNLYERQLNPDSKADQRMRREPGWETTANTKPVLIASLDEVIDAQGLIVDCPRMLSELRMFQNTNQAASGFHDDWVMALAIGVHNIRFATRYVLRIPMIERAEGDHRPMGDWGAGGRTWGGGGGGKDEAWG